jgi:hypothetical protein
MFPIEFVLNEPCYKHPKFLTVLGVVTESFGYINARVLSVQDEQTTITGKLVTIELKDKLSASIICDMEEALCERFIAIRNKFEVAPEDYPRDEMEGA